MAAFYSYPSTATNGNTSATVSLDTGVWYDVVAYNSSVWFVSPPPEPIPARPLGLDDALRPRLATPAPPALRFAPRADELAVATVEARILYRRLGRAETRPSRAIRAVRLRARRGY